MAGGGAGRIRRFARALLVELIDESSFDDDPLRSREYAQEYRLDRSEYRASSQHGVVCSKDGVELASVLLSNAGGLSGVHERSLLLLSNSCFVAVGAWLVRLELPRLTLRWSREVDSATCFGVHPTEDQRFLISHGELEISKLSLAGDTIWRAGGADIFSGYFRVGPDAVHAEDFNGMQYVFDLETGSARAS